MVEPLESYSSAASFRHLRPRWTTLHPSSVTTRTGIRTLQMSSSELACPFVLAGVGVRHRSFGCGAWGGFGSTSPLIQMANHPPSTDMLEGSTIVILEEKHGHCRCANFIVVEALNCWISSLARLKCVRNILILHSTVPYGRFAL